MMGATAKLTRRETTLDEMKSVKEAFDRLAAKHPGGRALLAISAGDKRVCGCAGEAGLSGSDR